MTNQDFITRIQDLYQTAHKKKTPNSRIVRGTSASISSDAEDLFAVYLDELLGKHNYHIWIDPQIVCDTLVKKTAKGGTKKILFRPDICVVEPIGKDIAKVIAVFELKLSLGYQRTFSVYAKEHADELKTIKRDTAHCKINGQKYFLQFNKNLTWEYVIVSGDNIGRDNLAEIRQAFARKKTLGNLYILSPEKDLSVATTRPAIDAEAFKNLKQTIAGIKS